MSRSTAAAQISNPLATSSRMSLSRNNNTASRNNLSRNNFSSLSAASRLSETLSSRTNETRQPIKNLDEVTVASTNLSIFSMTNSDRSMPLFRTYGKFNYFSYYEKFINMRSKNRIPKELMPELVGFVLFLNEFTLF